MRLDNFSSLEIINLCENIKLDEYKQVFKICEFSKGWYNILLTFLIVIAH